MGELLRLLHAARRSGVLGQIMDTMEVGEQPAGMSDATKRRKEDPERSLAPNQNGMPRLGNLRVARPLTTRPGM